MIKVTREPDIGPPHEGSAILMTDFKQYAAIPAVHWSGLKHMAKSPLHYRHAADHPGEDTSGRLKGRGTHTAVLEPDRFMLDYACYKGEKGKKPIRRGKRWEAFKAMHADDNILTLDEYQHCITVAAAVSRHPAAKAILAVAEREQLREWVDEETGLACKGRFDLVTADAVIDLKGVRSCDDHSLAREIAMQKYYCQLALYREGERVRTGKNPEALLICVEHTAPHDVVVRRLDEDGLYAGLETVRELMRKVAECQKAGRWPGRSESVETLRLPAWIWQDDEEDASGLDLDWSPAANAVGG